MSEGLYQQLKILNQLICTIAIELTDASLADAKERAKQFGSDSDWNKDVDVLSMRLNKLKRIEKRLDGPK